MRSPYEKENKTYEAVYKIACFLTDSGQTIHYKALAEELNRLGLKTQTRKEYTVTNMRAIGQMITAVWHYVEYHYGYAKAQKVYQAFHDKNEKLREDQTDRRALINRDLWHLRPKNTGFDHPFGQFLLARSADRARGSR